MTTDQIVSKLLIEKPYYGYIASQMKFQSDDSIQRMKLSMKGTPTVYYNPNWFGMMDNKTQVGAVVHEMLHVALLHFYRREGRDLKLWNIACDIAVTEWMAGYQYTDDIITRNVAARELHVTLEPGRSAEYYYKIIKVAEDLMEVTEDQGEASVVFESGKTYYNEVLEEVTLGDLDSETLVQALADVADSAEKERVIDLGMLSEVEEIYRGYQIQWRQVLKRFLSGHGRIQTRKSYKRQSRRFDDLPGTKRSVGLQALLAIDESGSISDHQVEVFRKELVRINQIVSDDIMVVRFDTKCSEPMTLQQFVQSKKREKGGGTDFRPVFELADGLKIKNVIVFTDGEGQAPASAEQRVLWVLTNNGKAPASYGVSVKFTET